MNVFTTKLHDVIYDEENAPQFIFLILDYCEYDIAKAILNQRPDNMEEDHVVTVVYNILCAINFIHSTGIMHRDLKPGNILINKECQIKICDFGISRSSIHSSKST